MVSGRSLVPVGCEGPHDVNGSSNMCKSKPCPRTSSRDVKILGRVFLGLKVTLKHVRHVGMKVSEVALFKGLFVK